MKCQCTLTQSKKMEGKCLHADVEDCNMKAKQTFIAPGQKLRLCNGCTRQYLKRWKPAEYKRIYV